MTMLALIVAVVVVLAAGFGVRVLWCSMLEYRLELQRRDEDLE